ncbi:MAG: hypothetical protein AAGD22_10740, partial [Verrucomicrobiota bacterium]
MRLPLHPFFLSITLSAFAANAQQEAQNAEPTEGSPLPNILLILADDFGWGDASCNNPDAA